jgi:hypothetical protein
MLRFMIDTDICSFILKRTNNTVLRRLRAIPINDVCISVMTLIPLPRALQNVVAIGADRVRTNIEHDGLRWRR